MDAGFEAGEPGRQVWLETGIPGLDTILSGGLLQGGLYLIEGYAGTGKTILGFQCGLNYARRGDRIVVVTLLSESHGRLIDHLRNFDFFDGSLIARSFLLLSGYGAAKEGLPSLLRLLAETLMRERPRLLIIDGFSGTRAFAGDDQDYAHFLLELSALVGAAGCTSLLLATLGKDHHAPQRALVDGIIELSTSAFGVRRIRELDVLKFRGADPIVGRHTFEIRKSGLHVYPRFEAVRTRRPTQDHLPKQKLAFGIPQLDAMLRGGVCDNSTTTVLGSPGVGKTALGLKFLEEGVRRGERAMYFGFYEQRERLLAKATGMGIHLNDAVESGLLTVHWCAPLEMLLDEVVERLLDFVTAQEPTRLVLDGMDGLRDAVVNAERNQPLTAALLHELKSRGLTTLVTEELPLFFEESGATSRSAPFVENIFYLRYVEQGRHMQRLLSVIKIRDGDHDSTIRPYTISATGFVLSDAPESEAAHGTFEE
jgi:circadian clock protein KaiC